MARFRKPVLKVGTYVTRSGEVLEATATRLQGWSDKLRQLRANRIKVPITWGHVRAAEPGEEDADQSEFWISAMCAGDLEDLDYDPLTETLYATGQAPGAEVDDAGNLIAWIKLPDGRQIKSAISQVSIGINNWRDGQGRTWDDVPVHLALCVLPVAHGMDGFEALSTRPEPLYLSVLLLAAARAPAGGISISGNQYRGGQFIPSNVLENASAEDKAKLAAAKDEHRAKLKTAVGGQGPDHDSLTDKLRPHRNVELNDRQLSEAHRTWAGIRGYHDDLALHRVHQLIHDDLSRLDKVKGKPEENRLRRRLRSYAHMLDWRQESQTAAREAEIAKRTGVQQVSVKDLQVDPERFQYKLGTGNEGVVKEGSALEGVKRFRPEFAGVILAWHDPADGKDYVVNGHHRHHLANQAGVDTMGVHYIEAKDAKEARKIGALANIAEGRGTAVDAAKLIRDEGFTPEDFSAEGVSIKGAMSRDAFTMSNLSTNLFRKLTLGQIEPKVALAVGTIPGHEAQDQFAGWLDKQDRDIPDKVLQRMAEKITNTPAVKTSERTLFGMDDREENLFLHRSVLETHVLAKLSQEANLFGAVSTEKKANILARGANVIQPEQNKQIADEARQQRAVAGTLVDRKGPIADAFNEAAEELYREPKNRKDIEARLIDRVRGLVRQEVGPGATTAAAAKSQNVPGSAGSIPASAGAPASRAPGTARPVTGADLTPELFEEPDALGVWPEHRKAQLQVRADKKKRGERKATPTMPSAAHIIKPAQLATTPDLTRVRPIGNTSPRQVTVVLSTGDRAMAEQNKAEADDDLFDEEDIVGNEDAMPPPGDQTSDQTTEDSVKAEIAQCLQEMGAAADPKEPLLDFLKHVLTALKTHKMTREKVQEEMNGNGTGMANGNGNGTSNAAEEQRPYLMSLLSRKADDERDPEKKALLLSLQANHRDRGEKAKKNRLARIDRLEKNGVPKHVADKMRQQAGGYQLSLADDGKTRPNSLDFELRSWEEAAAHFGGAKMLGTLTSMAREVPRPHPGNEDLKKLAQERAARVSVGTK